MSEDRDEYRRKMLLRSLELHDDQLVGELHTTKGGPVLNLLAQSRTAAADALDQMLALIRAEEIQTVCEIARLGRLVNQHFALMEFAQTVHIQGNSAYSELSQSDRLAISQGIMLPHSGDTTFADD